MRVALFCALIITTLSANAQQQSPLSYGTPTLTQEERRGDLVCTVYRQYGSPELVTISATSNVDLSRQDIAGCVRAAMQKMKVFESGAIPQNFKKKS